MVLQENKREEKIWLMLLDDFIHCHSTTYIALTNKNVEFKIAERESKSNHSVTTHHLILTEKYSKGILSE